jgi:enterochelin esterase-like enzyme
LPAAPSPSAAPLPRASTGTIERIRIASATVDERPIDVWLPEDYAARARAGHRYQVLYMQDGQMLFDPATTWNRQAWRVDEILGRLIREGRVPDTIVVGIWNNGKYRASEYFPQKFLDHMAPAVRDAHVGQALEGRARADDYLRYLVTQVKPAIDKRYATRSDAAGTFIMGSSMGGLISVYAFTEYPQVFGGAAGLSTHWVGSFAPNASIPLAAFNYLSRTLPAPEGRRLYLDRGTATLDALYGPAQAFVDQIVRERGYGVSGYESRVFEGAEHSERAWSERLEIPLLFLLEKR